MCNSGQTADAVSLIAGGYDEVVIATGITPGTISFPGSDDPVSSATSMFWLAHVPVGSKVAIIGAGGIGFDVAEFLVEHAPSPTTDVARWTREWGVDMQLASTRRPAEAATGIARSADLATATQRGSPGWHGSTKPPVGCIAPRSRPNGSKCWAA
jgi:hypothetical protein